MITVLRDGTRLVVHLEHGLLDGGHLLLYWEAGRDLLADALVRHVRDRLAETIKQTRQEEYARGWKAGRGHRAVKEKWFWDRLECAK